MDHFTSEKSNREVAFEPAVRGRAVYIVGASSVGKTTLCKALASTLSLESDRHIQEIARGVMKTHGFTRDHIHTIEMQHAIMIAQLEAEQSILRQGGSSGSVLLLSDRSAVDPIVYAATAGLEDSASNASRLRHDASFQSILPFYRQALFIVLQPVVEWMEDDGIRSLEDPWRYNAQLQLTLAELSIPFIEICEAMRDLSERVEFVRTHLL